MQSSPTKQMKESSLRALRLNLREIVSIGVLFFVTIISWCITEGTTTIFREKMNAELRNVISSDISILSQSFPSNIDREFMRVLGLKYNARYTESIEFPFTIEQKGGGTMAIGTGSRYITSNIRIVDENYPLYGTLEYSGSFSSGAIMEGELFTTIDHQGFSISQRNIPVTGLLLKAPGLSQNPFAMNRDVLIRNSLLPFETITASGAGYRVQYKMGFALASEGQKGLLKDLKTRFGNKDTGIFRVSEERNSGGNFSDIANTFNDFLGSILSATMLIALSTFIVAFSRFSVERKKLVRIVLWMGLSETTIISLIFWRFLLFFGVIGTTCLIIFSFLPGIGLYSVITGLIFVLITLIIGLALCIEIFLQDSALISRLKNKIRIVLGIIFLLLFGGYLLLSGESLRILPFAIIGIIALERFSWIAFRVASWIFSSQKNISPSRFFLLDALRSFRNSPILGKVSFSVFFLLSATISSVFLFSLAFQDTLKQTTDSQINTFVINLLPKDYEKLSTWIPKRDFYSTIRARIISINGKSLATHLGTPEVSREFSREFNITDGETNKAIIAGKPAMHNREITIDADFSKRINIGIDSTVEFSLAGRSFVFNVVGIRESKQKGVTPFFYFQIPNNAIYGAPKTYFLATSVSENIDGWKSRILNETGTYISFIDVGAILKQVRSYAQMVLQGVLGLLLYITIIGLLAFMTAERAFFQLKIRKIQLYRLLGCSEKNGFQLLFFESILGNIIPMIIGSVVGGVIILYLLRNNPILKITYIIIAVALLVLMVFFLISFFYTRHSIQGHIKKTDPRIGGIDE